MARAIPIEFLGVADLISLASTGQPRFLSAELALFQGATGFHDFKTCERPSRLGRGSPNTQ